jgi:hypothetical protein
MSKTRTFLLVAVAFLSGGILGAWGIARYYSEMLTRATTHGDVALLGQEVRTLEHLRNGRITNAVENLEMNLDWSIICVAPLLEKKTKSAIEETYVRTIEKARDYRARFPRKSKPEVDDKVAKVFTRLDAQPRH